MTVTDAIGCFATVSATVVGNLSPTAFTVTGGGLVCTTDIVGIPVGLSGSQLNVNYQLFRNGVPVGLPVPGTGFAITFGQHIAGTYTVTATSASGGCFARLPDLLRLLPIIVAYPSPILVFASTMQLR